MALQGLVAAANILSRQSDSCSPAQSPDACSASPILIYCFPKGNTARFSRKTKRDSIEQTFSIHENRTMASNIRGALFGALITTITDENGNYSIICSDKAMLHILAHAAGSKPRGNTLLYTDALDAAIRDAIDTLADLRQHRPGFGQITLDL